jgi:tetratricopeptide (TPR) repeat protein
VQKLKKPEDKAFWAEESGKHNAGVVGSVVGGTYFEQAEEAFKYQDYRKAEALYLQVLRENPRNVKVYNRLGVIYLEQKKYNDAVESFKLVLSDDSKVASRNFNLALAYIGQGNYGEAKPYLEEAVKLSPENEKYKKVLEDTKKK